MGSYRPGMGKKRKRSEGDFRWKKWKGQQKREPDVVGGDALDEGPVFTEVQPEQKQIKKESPRQIKNRQREGKRRRREMHEAERTQADALIRSAPDEYLWKQYIAWVEKDLFPEERTAKEWNEKHVSVVEYTGGPLMPAIKEVIGKDYVERAGYSGGTPGVAVIALAASALKAVDLARKIRDGREVGKLFSKHIKIAAQKAWLQQSCRKGLVPSAVGTAKRVQRLIAEGDMTLDHTAALVIDMSRDLKLLNITDMDSTREELFEFLHRYCRSQLKAQKMKIILCIPKVQATRLEDVKDELLRRKERAESAHQRKT